MISKGQGKTEAEKFFVSKVNDGTLIVSKDGTCFNTRTKRYIGLNKSNNRYSKISTARNGRKDILHIQCHRLSWIVYNGDIPETKEINHLDANGYNWCLSNLELVTKSENMQHALKMGLLPDQKGANNNNYRGYSIKVNAASS